MVGFRALVARCWRIRSSLLFAAVVLAGCGSSARTATSDITGSTAQPSAEAELSPVALHLNRGSYSLSASGTTIAGTATGGASVTVNGHAVPVRSGQWRDTLRLHIGPNPVDVEATMSGRAPTSTVIQVVRHHSAAELEALARARVQREEAKRRREVEARERRERRKQEQHVTGEKQQALAECTNGTYVNAAGNTVCKPVESSTQPAGATAECEDGSYSFSESRSGTCSHHGGVKQWLDE